MAESSYNTTEWSTSVQNYEDEDYQFDMIMGVWLPGVICVLGIVGNLLCWLVLSRDGTKCPTFYTLRALATSDIVLLIAALLQQVIPMYCIVTRSIDRFCLIQGYIRVYAWPVICITQLTSMWFTVLISAERYIAICRPFQAAAMCNIPKVRIAVISIIVFAVLFNIPKFFEFHPIKKPHPELQVVFISIGGTELRKDPVYRYLYHTALLCLVLYAVPLSLLIYLNFRIVQSMKSARKQWRWLNRRTKLEMKATVLPLVIVCVVFVCSTQALMAFILDAVYLHHTWLQKYTAFVNILVILNSAINFILMYLFGKKFRAMMMKMLLCSKYKKGSPVLTSKIVTQSEGKTNFTSSSL